MIIPEGGEKVYSRRFPLSVLKAVAALLSIWCLSLVVMTLLYSQLALQAAKATMLEKENGRLRDYFARVVEIEESFKKNRELAVRLAKMAGVNLEEVNLEESINLDSLRALQSDSAYPAIFPPAALETSLSPEQLARQKIPLGRPLYGWITKPFIADTASGREKHEGIDFAVKRGTSVLATASGVVKFAGWDKDLGNLVIIDHENGYETFYGHNSKLLVEKGERVLKGDVIALSGSTGQSTAPHLHYEIRKDGKPVDPEPYLD